MNNCHYDVIIIGGGLAGLTAAIALSQHQKNILLIEKKKYPFHKVCGEYISNEVLPYLKSLEFDPYTFGASTIKRLRISTPKGKNIHIPLDLGGFGLSRHTMDHALFQLAQTRGVTVCTDEKVTDVLFENDEHIVKTSSEKMLSSKLVIGSYGKRDMLDKKLNRDFINTHTGYLGVKYHINTDYPVDEIGLDNFSGGYCGIVRIENNKYNLCYLYKKPKVKNYKNIKELEENILHQNPVLRAIFKNSDFLHKTPEVINEISFSPKKLVEHHILMSGDTAGLITPLCGNGMAMAIGTAKLLTDLIIRTKVLDSNIIGIIDRMHLEREYSMHWNAKFSSRLSWGRLIQRFFGNPLFTGFFATTIHQIPPLERKLLSYTHGEPL